MTTPSTRLRGGWIVAWVAAVVAVVVALVLLFRVGFSSPHLVAAAIRVNDGEVLLLTSPIDRRPRWMVYGLDGRPRRAWGAQALPGGIVEEADGKLRNPTAEIESAELLEGGMTRLAKGQTRYFSDPVGSRFVHFQEPPGILLQRLSGDANHDHLERVRLDGSLVWSQSLTTLLGTVSFRPGVTQVVHAELRLDGRSLLLVIQAYASHSARPVDVALSRFVIVDAPSGRVLQRTDILPPAP